MAVLGILYLGLLLVLVLVAPIWLLAAHTTTVRKWLSLIFAVLFLAGAWASAAPKDVDIPPCHMMVSFALWAAAAYKHWLRPANKPFPPGYCGKCGYNLTGNVSGICPECGKEQRGHSGMPLTQPGRQKREAEAIDDGRSEG